MPLLKRRTPYRADIEAALPAYGASNIERAEIATLESKLEDGEKVLSMAAHRMTNVVVLTDRRILNLFDRRGRVLMPPIPPTDASYRLSEIDNLSWTGGGLQLLIRGTRVLIPNIAWRREFFPVVQEAWAAARAAAHEPAPVAGGPGSDAISQLERLQSLRDSGALTEDEFQTMKAQVLGSR